MLLREARLLAADLAVVNAAGLVTWLNAAER